MRPRLALVLGLLVFLRSPAALQADAAPGDHREASAPRQSQVTLQPTPSPLQRLRFTFDDAPLGELPLHWKQGSSGEGSADWSIVAGDRNQVLAQTRSDNPNRHFNLCWFEPFRARNLALQTKLRAVSGQHDQGGGLAWRIQDERNYYVVRVNPLENNVVLYKMVNGERTDLPLVGAGRTYGLKASTSTKHWHVLAVDVQDDTFSVSLDGRSLFQVRDNTFSQAGAVGLWTKADAVTEFDDLQILALP